jgi:HAD superfamily phosphatase (TIGR01668 family)
LKYWRSGTFDKSKVSERLQPLVPARAEENLAGVDLAALWESGKRLLLLDVDNTLVRWKGEDLDPGILSWLGKAKEMGFQLCIISNTRRVERLERLSAKLSIPTVRGKFKPSRAMFRLALIKFKRSPEEAVMIGDQLFTDVLGANRTGIDAIWVRRMAGKEFGPTKISRLGERLLSGAIYQALVTPVDEQDSAPKPLFQRAIFRQFVKFCVVGGSSFVIDTGLRMLLMFAVPWRGELLSIVAGRWLLEGAPALFAFAHEPKDAFFPIASFLAASVAILNSFLWNRMWTFQIRGKQERFDQLRRFVIVSIIGLGLNVVLSTIFNQLLPGDPRRTAPIATLMAAVIVAFWNFGGQRLYAFRKRSH